MIRFFLIIKYIVEKVVYPIESAEDLSQQSEILYGCVSSGSTCGFFKESKIPTYSNMWKFMAKRPHVFTKSNAEGKKRVLQGNYAFLMVNIIIIY